MTKTFEQLTKAERKKYCNGCGGKGGFIKVPNFFFKACCDKHDYSYWLGGTEADRKRADRGFYRAMRHDVTKLPWWRKTTAHALALTYYTAVRVWGWKFFTYTDKMDDIEHKSKTN